MSINFDKELKEGIQQQLKDNAEEAYGCSQAILYLASGRNIEIDLEKRVLAEKIIIALREKVTSIPCMQIKWSIAIIRLWSK